MMFDLDPVRLAAWSVIAVVTLGILSLVAFSTLFALFHQSGADDSINYRILPAASFSIDVAIRNIAMYIDLVPRRLGCQKR